MTKVLKINRCWDCPHHRHSPFRYFKKPRMTCCHPSFKWAEIPKYIPIIPDTYDFPIPDWCPLEAATP